MNTTPTRRQYQVFEWIRDFVETNGYCPTVRELCEHFKYASPNAAFGMMKALKKKGLVTWNEGQQRTLRVAKP